MQIGSDNHKGQTGITSPYGQYQAKSAPIAPTFSAASKIEFNTTISSQITDETGAAANNGEDIAALLPASANDEKMSFNQLLQHIEAMRWGDPIGAANRLLEIDTDNLPFESHESYSQLAQDLSAQLVTMEGSIAQITLWDLGRSLQELETTSLNLFGSDPDQELTSLLGGSSMESLSADITDFIAEQAQDETGLLDNTGLVGKIATILYTKQEMDRLDSLPKGQYNPEAARIDEINSSQAAAPEFKLPEPSWAA